MRTTLPDAAGSPEDELPERGHELTRVRRALTETRAVLAKADALYAPYRCPASAECCQLATTGRPPWLWPTEWRLLVDRLAREGRPLPGRRADGACALLDEGGRRCSVYADRPFGCRTFFCHRATGPASQPAEPTDGLLRRLAALNLELDSEAGPRPLVELLAGPGG